MKCFCLVFFRFWHTDNTDFVGFQTDLIFGGEAAARGIVAAHREAGRTKPPSAAQV
jgi:hypothetical protein